MDMRISSVYNAYSVQSGRGVSQSGTRVDKGRVDADSVSLSAQAGDYQAARRAVANAPDIREGIVGKIQEMLDAGTYRVSAQDVAARIFRGA